MAWIGGIVCDFTFVTMANMGRWRHADMAALHVVGWRFMLFCFGEGYFTGHGLLFLHMTGELVCGLCWHLHSPFSLSRVPCTRPMHKCMQTRVIKCRQTTLRRRPTAAEFVKCKLVESCLLPFPDLSLTCCMRVGISKAHGSVECRRRPLLF